MKTCVVCGETLVPRSREHRSAFAERVTCSYRCSGLKGRQRQEIPPKLCEVCGTEFVRGDTERIAEFEIRQTCGTECGHKLTVRRRRIEPDPRPCVGCGTLIARRPNELIQTFRERRTCGKTRCVSIAKSLGSRKGSHRVHPYPIGWASRISQMIRRRDGHACQLCGVIGGKPAHPVHQLFFCTDSHYSQQFSLQTRALHLNQS